MWIPCLKKRDLLKPHFWMTIRIILQRKRVSIGPVICKILKYFYWVTLYIKNTMELFDWLPFFTILKLVPILELLSPWRTTIVIQFFEEKERRRVWEEAAAGKRIKDDYGHKVMKSGTLCLVDESLCRVALDSYFVPTARIWKRGKETNWIFKCYVQKFDRPTLDLYGRFTWRASDILSYLVIANEIIVCCVCHRHSDQTFGSILDAKSQSHS